MRRRVAAWTVLFAALCGWVGVSALIGEAPSASAQEGTPSPVVIERLQRAAYWPAEGEDNRPLTVLAIGSDARPGDDVESHLADSLHLITINPEEGAATILGFPRDSYVEIPGVGTRKINEALFSGGAERVAETIEGLTGIPIDYYFLTGFEGFKRMVGAVGGIEVHVPYAMNDSASGAVFDEGPQVLDGSQALAFSRNRKNTPNGDFSRSENQGIFIQSALISLHRAYMEDPTAIFQWMVTGVTNTQSNLSLGELLGLATTMMQIDPAKVTNLVVPGSTGSAGDASVVFISDAAQDIYADIRDDGVIG